MYNGNSAFTINVIDYVEKYLYLVIITSILYKVSSFANFFDKIKGSKICKKMLPLMEFLVS